jgi:hypothetical protein
MGAKVSAEVTAMLDPGTAVEVRCHPGCPWVGGWEIVEVETSPSGPHYGVRRRGQLQRLHTLLPSDDVRPTRRLVEPRAS